MPIYMHIPGVNGDVTSKNHNNWIEIKSVTFHTKRNLNTQPGRIADREGSRPSVSEIEITKIMDKTSPLLFSESVTGNAKSQVEIHMCTTNDTITPFQALTLSNVVVSGYTMHPTTQDFVADKNTVDRSTYPTETIRLNFTKIETKFTPFDAKHKPQSPIPAGYDLETAAAA